MYRAIKKILKEEEYLTESGIKIPHGTKSVKIFGHSDLDGFFSMMLVYNQLIKQGVPKNRIRLNFIQYGFNAKEMAEKLSVKPGEMTAMVDFGALPKTYKDGDEEKVMRAPDFWSDHHKLNPESGELHKSQKSSGAIGKTDFGSDSEHIATVNAQGISDYNTIKEITNVDSAKFSNIENNIFFTNEFVGKDRNEKLAILTSTFINELIKKNPEAAKEVIRNAKPTLISIYSTAKRYMGLTTIQNEAITELAKDDPDWNIIDKARKAMPNQKMANKIRKGEKPMTVMDLNALKEKTNRDIKKSMAGDWSTQDEKEFLKAQEELQKLKLKKEKSGNNKYDELISELSEKFNAKKQEREEKKGTFNIKGNVIVQNIPSPSATTGRYLGDIIVDKDGKRLPFKVRRFNDMIQFSVNPDVNKEDKKKIDLVDDMKKIIDLAKKHFGTKYNEWAFDLIKEKSGGHAAITNISETSTLALLNAKKRGEFRNLKKIDEKINSLKSFKSKDEKLMKKLKDLSFDVISKKRSDDYKILQKEKEIKNAWKKRVMDFMENAFIILINRKYKDVRVDKETKFKFSLPED